jgi:hypothetical protein
MHLNEQAARNVTLATCHALLFHLAPHENEVSRSVIIWRGSRADFRLVRRVMFGLGMKWFIGGALRESSTWNFIAESPHFDRPSPVLRGAGLAAFFLTRPRPSDTVAFERSRRS